MADAVMNSSPGPTSHPFGLCQQHYHGSTRVSIGPNMDKHDIRDGHSELPVEFVIEQKNAEIERLRAKLLDVAAWLRRMAEANDRKATDCGVEALRESYLHDARNYRATAADIKTMLSSDDKKAGERFTPLLRHEVAQLAKCQAGEDITSFDRTEEAARTRLKTLGYIVFDRPSYRWQITESGRAALAAHAVPR